MCKKVYLLTVAAIFLIGIGTIALGTQITIDGASVIWEQSPELPLELLNVSAKVQPRILAEYATTLFEQDISYPTELINVTSDVPGRIVVEYASSIGQFDLLTDGFIETGDTAAVFRVTQEGNVRADGSYYGQAFLSDSADVAEWVLVSEPVEPGDVLELDPDNPGYYRKSQTACSSLVAGVVSTQPGFVLGSSSPTLDFGLSASSADRYRAGEGDKRRRTDPTRRSARVLLYSRLCYALGS